MNNIEKLSLASRLLLEVENDEACSWCRGHVKIVRNALNDLVTLANFSESVKERPRQLQAMRVLGERAEALKVLALMARVLMVLGR